MALPAMAAAPTQAAAARVTAPEPAAAGDDEAAFRRFRDYDWEKDAAFLNGLAAMYARWTADDPGITDEELAQRTAAAKAFYFEKCAAIAAAWRSPDRAADLTYTVPLWLPAFGCVPGTSPRWTGTPTRGGRRPRP